MTCPVLTALSVRVLDDQVGDNMPCTNGSAIEAVYEQDAEGFNVKGSLDLGGVSNVGKPWSVQTLSGGPVWPSGKALGW